MTGFPSWRYGPNGEEIICDSAEDVPEGFVDHPCKLKPKGGDLSAAIEVIQEAATDLAKFDHDGDGKPGGSKPRRKKAVSNGPRF